MGWDRELHWSLRLQRSVIFPLRKSMRIVGYFNGDYDRHVEFIFEIFAETNVKETFKNEVVFIIPIVKPVLFCTLILVPFYFIVVFYYFSVFKQSICSNY